MIIYRPAASSTCFEHNYNHDPLGFFFACRMDIRHAAQIWKPSNHGATVKCCGHKGCTNVAKIGGASITHGVKMKRCSNEGCTNIALRGDVCTTQGTRVKQYSQEGVRQWSP